MRTTIDLSDDLFCRAKAMAKLKGVKLKDLLASMIEEGLRENHVDTGALGRKGPFPIRLDLPGFRIRPFTNDDALFGPLDDLCQPIEAESGGPESA